MLPSVSVVIPCLNDAGPLEACLKTLAAQTHPPMEIIVVDNGSTDGSASVARRHGAILVRESVPGIAAAASAGYDLATGDVIARCDADSLLPASWIQQIASTFHEDPALGALTGPGTFYELRRPWLWLWNVVYVYGYFAAVGAALAGVPLFGSNMAIRRSCWEAVRSEVHRHDVGMHDDMCLSMHLGLRFRIRFRRSLRVGISPRALVGRGNRRRRIQRAFHTLGVHGTENLPWNRWARRLGLGKTTGRLHTK